MKLARLHGAAIGLSALVAVLPCRAAEPDRTISNPAVEPGGDALTLIADWSRLPNRRWAGPAIWTNRLQDWMVRNGALVCEPAERNTPCRTAHVLTYQLADQPGPFRIQTLIRMPQVLKTPKSATQSTTTRPGLEDITAPPVPIPRGSAQVPFVGFLVGAGEGRLDYRAASLVHHCPGKGGGILAVFNLDNPDLLSFLDMGGETGLEYPKLDGQKKIDVYGGLRSQPEILLRLEGVRDEAGTYDLRLSAWSADGKELLAARELVGVPSARLLGNVALVANPGAAQAIFAFENIKLGGPRFQFNQDHAFGPIAGTMYSVSGKTLKLSAQFMHLGEALLDNDPEATEAKRMRTTLQIRPAGQADDRTEWKTVGLPEGISPPDYCVLFRVNGWDASRAWIARVMFQDADGKQYTYDTLIRRNPLDKSVISVAGFTGMGVMGRTAYQSGPQPKEGEVLVGRWTPANVWMPFAESVRALHKQDLDALFFTGDQIYDGKPSPRDNSRLPFDDYLYKWLMWHWSFRELTRTMPAICQADDHDVYHGNLWGWSGRLNLTGNNSDGGYLYSPSFVNMVHRTMTCHDPDPYDAGPTDTGITNYYTHFAWGGVGFAVLEDRKFKTPKAVTDPAEQEQLGKRQMQMLKAWGEDWTGEYFKVIVSQTIYASMHVDGAGRLVMDADSNGFPKIRRDESVRMFQRCGAFILCGDQHLATFARLGIEKPSDAVYQFCVPAMGNIFWRWFYPTEPGTDLQKDEPDYGGEFIDRFGNFFRMIAVANPERKELLGQKLRQRYLLPQAEAGGGLGDTLRTCMGDGYGIVRFDKKALTVTVECWPYNADPVAGGKPFAGWPIMLQYDELDGRKPVTWLPDLKIEGGSDAVVQIIDQKTGEAIKIARAKDGFFRPGVFTTDGAYTLRVGSPETGRAWWTARDLAAGKTPGAQTLSVNLK